MLFWSLLRQEPPKFQDDPLPCCDTDVQQIYFVQEIRFVVLLLSKNTGGFISFNKTDSMIQSDMPLLIESFDSVSRNNPKKNVNDKL